MAVRFLGFTNRTLKLPTAPSSYQPHPQVTNRTLSSYQPHPQVTNRTLKLPTATSPVLVFKVGHDALLDVPGHLPVGQHLHHLVHLVYIALSPTHMAEHSCGGTRRGEGGRGGMHVKADTAVHSWGGGVWCMRVCVSTSQPSIQPNNSTTNHQPPTGSTKCRRGLR